VSDFLIDNQVFCDCEQARALLRTLGNPYDDCLTCAEFCASVLPLSDYNLAQLSMKREVYPLTSVRDLLDVSVENYLAEIMRQEMETSK